jgi:hypothetical protein
MPSYGTYDLPTGYRGDTYKALTFRFYNQSGSGISFAGYKAKLEVRSRRTNDLVLRLTTDDNSMYINGSRVTINNIPRSKMNMWGDVYNYDMQITSGNNIRTYIQGRFPIVDDVTEGL